MRWSTRAHHAACRISLGRLAMGRGAGGLRTRRTWHHGRAPSPQRCRPARDSPRRFCCRLVRLGGHRVRLDAAARCTRQGTEGCTCGRLSAARVPRHPVNLESAWTRVGGRIWPWLGCLCLRHHAYRIDHAGSRRHVRAPAHRRDRHADADCNDEPHRSAGSRH
jgi:hypothetical protein